MKRNSFRFIYLSVQTNVKYSLQPTGNKTQRALEALGEHKPPPRQAI